MNQPMDQHAWRESHLRKARGETLTGQEEQWYLAEVARQDAEASPPVYGLDDLKKLREQTTTLTAVNEDLQGRVKQLEMLCRLPDDVATKPCL